MKDVKERVLFFNNFCVNSFKSKEGFDWIFFFLIAIHHG